jgi:hypothetical protein
MGGIQLTSDFYILSMFRLAYKPLEHLESKRCRPFWEGAYMQKGTDEL